MTHLSNRNRLIFLSMVSPLLTSLHAAEILPSETDSVRTELGEAIVTGTQVATDVRHLPWTVSTIARGQLTQDHRPNLLPTLSEQVPGLMITGRGMMGYGVSSGGGRRHDASRTFLGQWTSDGIDRRSSAV